jgi:UDP-GlcNAc3NAcA epimerase
MKVMTIVGARPQFIKASAVSRAILAAPELGLEEFLIHTGQHHDENMSKVFFEELGIPEPRQNLRVAGGTHGEMTGRMMVALEPVMAAERPDWVLVYGDTNSTLAGALVAAKMHIRVAHVEAGLRSHNMRMPEEINRIVADRVSTLLFCPTATAVKNLQTEGRVAGVRLVGDVMYDVALHYGAIARKNSRSLQMHSLRPGQYVLATCHRAENTDFDARLAAILEGLGRVSESVRVLLPLHPRTRAAALRLGLGRMLDRVTVVEPLPYLEMLALEQDAAAVITDSGGVQKEAFFFGVPCITVRDETEWTETVESGWNRLVAAVGDPAHGLAQDLAGPGLGQRRYDVDGGEAGHRSDRMPHRRHQFGGQAVGGGAGLEHHQSARHLTLYFIGYADHRALGHRRMRRQDRLDRAR